MFVCGHSCRSMLTFGERSRFSEPSVRCSLWVKNENGSGKVRNLRNLKKTTKVLESQVVATSIPAYCFRNAILEQFYGRHSLLESMYIITEQ
jgi:hypothetical protein